MLAWWEEGRGEIFRHNKTVWLAGFVALGAALRFWNLGEQALWLDEATTAAFAARAFPDCAFAEIHHPPLFNTIIHFFLRAFGEIATGASGAALRVEGASDALVRVPSAVFGTLTIPAMWLLAGQVVRWGKRELRGAGEYVESRVGSEAWSAQWFATALVSVSPFLIYLSQEARNYSLFILLSIVSTWLFLRWAGDDARRHCCGLLLYTIAAVALVYTHYFGALVLFAHEVMFWRQGARPRGTWIASRAVIVLAFAPWAMWVVNQVVRGSMSLEAREWIGEPWLRLPYSLMRYFDGYGIAAANLTVPPTTWQTLVRREGLAVVLTLAPFFLLLFHGARRAWQDKFARWLFAAFLVAPLIPLLLLTPWMKLIHERYLGFQTAFFILLVALGWASLGKRGRVVMGLLCAASVIFSLTAYYGAPGTIGGYELRYGKEGWRTAARIVEKANVDAVILAPGYIQLPFERYATLAPSVQRYYFPTGAGADEGMVELPAFGGPNRVAVVVSHAGPAELAFLEEFLAKRVKVSDVWIEGQSGIRVIICESIHSE